MKKAGLRAFRTLVRIRVRRQENLDKARIEAQQELKRLEDAVTEVNDELSEANECVVEQIRKIDQLTASGGQFQIADYLSQEDYRGALEEKAAQVRIRLQQAESAVTQQEEALREARNAAALNLRQRERLEERIRGILLEVEVKKMDDEDEEAEEAVVTRKLVKERKAELESGAGSHA